MYGLFESWLQQVKAGKVRICLATPESGPLVSLIAVDHVDDVFYFDAVKATNSHQD